MRSSCWLLLKKVIYSFCLVYFLWKCKRGVLLWVFYSVLVRVLCSVAKWTWFGALVVTEVFITLMDLQPHNFFPLPFDHAVSPLHHSSSSWSSAPQFVLPRQGPILEMQDDYIAYRRMMWSRKVVATLVDWKDMPIFRLQAIIDGIWNLQDHVLIKSKYNNTFILEFANDDEKDFMLSNGPWAVQQSLLVLDAWQPDTPVDRLEKDRIEVWFRITGVPLEFMCNSFAKLIGDIIGGTVKLDPHNDSGENLAFLRLKASLDKNMPLFMGAFLPTEFGEKIWISYTLERTYRVCEQCGRISHLPKECKWDIFVTLAAMQQQRQKHFLKKTKVHAEFHDYGVKYVVRDLKSEQLSSNIISAKWSSSDSSDSDDDSLPSNGEDMHMDLSPKKNSEPSVGNQDALHGGNMPNLSSQPHDQEGTVDEGHVDSGVIINMQVDNPLLSLAGASQVQQDVSQSNILSSAVALNEGDLSNIEREKGFQEFHSETLFVEAWPQINLMCEDLRAMITPMGSLNAQQPNPTTQVVSRASPSHNMNVDLPLDMDLGFQFDEPILLTPEPHNNSLLIDMSFSLADIIKWAEAEGNYAATTQHSEFYSGSPSVLSKPFQSSTEVELMFSDRASNVRMTGDPSYLLATASLEDGVGLALIAQVTNFGTFKCDIFKVRRERKATLVFLNNFLIVAPGLEGLFILSPFNSLFSYLVWNYWMKWYALNTVMSTAGVLFLVEQAEYDCYSVKRKRSTGCLIPFKKQCFHLPSAHPIFSRKRKEGPPPSSCDEVAHVIPRKKVNWRLALEGLHIRYEAYGLELSRYWLHHDNSMAQAAGMGYLSFCGTDPVGKSGGTFLAWPFSMKCELKGINPNVVHVLSEDFRDLSPNGVWYTWTNKRKGDSMVWERLDRALCSVKKRHTQNHISALINDHGEWISNYEHIEEMGLRYFSDIFTEASSTNSDQILLQLRNYDILELSTHHSASLTNPFSMEEIMSAFKQMKLDSAPGTDGMNCRFFKRFWGEIGSVLPHRRSYA
ncbi:cysteine desulfurase mitochondrial-like [Senna tora]|uniref:Cysteine desulfurase mitochondrial-like n=1 Tax=Senna tora TaxID=362788 RepID=A0A834W773_9FABA|nr:cysteine desulfurase mitochondrial-like [Senna tora]